MFMAIQILPQTVVAHMLLSAQLHLSSFLFVKVSTNLFVQGVAEWCWEGHPHSCVCI